MEKKEKLNIPAAKPYFPVEDMPALMEDIKQVIQSGILTGGPNVLKFEEEFAKCVGTKYAVSVSSGTASLEILMRYFKIKGKEVIVPTNTFVATANAVVLAGGRPVFADMDPDSLCIDLKSIKKKVTSKTKGVSVVHIAGMVCPEMEEIREFCNKKDLFLIEDAAHAHGATYKNKKAGNLSDAGSFSFFPTKVMTCGEGGMITTNDPKLDEFARMLRSHGVRRETLLMEQLGNNWRLPELSAVVGRHQLKYLDSFVKRRNEIAKQYDSKISVKGKSNLVQTNKKGIHSYYKYCLKLDEKISKQEFCCAMKEKHGVSIGTCYWPPVHKNPYYEKNYVLKKNELANSETVLDRVVCLPMHAGMTDHEVQYVIESFLDVMKK